MSDTLLRYAHVLTALAGMLLIGRLGRAAARGLRQPEVVGEIVAGLLAGPAAVALLGSGRFSTVLPAGVLDDLKLVALAGLVLYLVGLAQKLRPDPQGRWLRETGWLVAGGLLPALLSGLAFAGWILLTGDTGARGHAPLSAFLLMCAVALSITAVPVLARILAERRMTDTEDGRLAMTAAVTIDTVGWLLLSVAVGLASGEPGGFPRALTVLAGGAVAAFGMRAVLRTQVVGALAERQPRLGAVLLAALALTMALAVEHLGLTAVFGAVLAGVAVPPEGPWSKAVAAVTRVGRGLVPVFFVTTGATVFAHGIGPLPWALMAVGTLLAVLGKGGGSYVGTRLAGRSRQSAARVAVLMNARGLTELIVLKVGHSAGILTTDVFVAFVVMAVVTTALTGPLLLVVDRPGPDRAAGIPVDLLSRDGLR